MLALTCTSKKLKVTKIVRSLPTFVVTHVSWASIVKSLPPLLAFSVLRTALHGRLLALPKQTAFAGQGTTGRSRGAADPVQTEHTVPEALHPVHIAQMTVSHRKLARVSSIAPATSGTQVQMADLAHLACPAASKTPSDRLAHTFAAAEHMPMPQECHSASRVRLSPMHLLEVQTSQTASVYLDTQAWMGDPVNRVRPGNIAMPLGRKRAFCAREANIWTMQQVFVCT